MMHCTNCGQELSEGVRFCSNCGAPVGPAPENDFTAEESQARSYEEPREEYVEPRPEPHEQEGSQTQTPPSDTKAIVSLVCGVIAAITMFTGAGAVLGIVVAIVGLIFGIKARKENPSTMATVGIILCALTLALCALIFVGCLACIGSGIAAGAGTELLGALTT